MGGQFQFKYSVIWESVPILLVGIKLTIFITVFGLILGFTFGTLAGLAKSSKKKILNRLAGVYIESIRGTPLMVQVLFLYFGLPWPSASESRPWRRESSPSA